MIISETKTLDRGIKTNMNVLVLGLPGSGKTRGHILPNLLDLDCSAIVLDPKGELYDMTSEPLKNKGFDIKMIDFEHPEQTLNYYNPLEYCKTTDDIVKLSRILVPDVAGRNTDPFWNCSARILSNAIMGLMFEDDWTLFNGKMTLDKVQELLNNIKPSDVQRDTIFTRGTGTFFAFIEKNNRNSWAVRQFNSVVSSAERTMRSIIISLSAEFCEFMSGGISELTSRDTVDLASIGKRKTVLYVKSSDTDRSKDKLVSMLFCQAMNVLFDSADANPSKALDVHTHFFLDDLGTNLTIPDLDKYIAACRGREISFSLILQSMGQLKKMYGEAYTAITNSCACQIYLGGIDIETCDEYARRLNVPIDRVMYKKRDEVFVFINGQRPTVDKMFDVRQHPLYRESVGRSGEERI